MLEYVVLASSIVSAVGYDAATTTLAVRFTDGSEYHYSDVPEDVYQGLLAADSAGAYFNQYVKDADFPFARVR